MSIYTEAEAREKWCPMARSSIGEGSFNRSAVSPGNASEEIIGSLGSDCMTWRWEDTVSAMRFGTNERGAPVRKGVERTTAHGYCGLAGKVGF